MGIIIYNYILNFIFILFIDLQEKGKTNGQERLTPQKQQQMFSVY